jgi:penicillin amidase
VRLLREAFAQHPTPDARVRSALGLLDSWDGRMEADSPAAALMALHLKHLFHEIFDDKLGQRLADAYRAKANLSYIMMSAVLAQPESRWFDRTDTPEVEDRAAILRRSFEAGVKELTVRLGGEPRTWSWGRLHTLTLSHPLGAVAVLAPYFNVGPVPMPGHALTVFKEESYDGDFKIHMGPSLRQITDLGDLAHGLAVIPGGQSGIPASKHYADLFALWRAGQYHPFLMERADVDAAAEGRLQLVPQEKPAER